MKWTLEIGQSLHEIVDADQLRAELLAEHQRAKTDPVIALINAPDGSRLAVGLGAERSVLNYIEPGGWPSRHAIGTEAVEGLIQYNLAGQLTEVQLRGTVPFQAAIDACLYFMRNGKTTELLEWQND